MLRGDDVVALQDVLRYSTPASMLEVIAGDWVGRLQEAESREAPALSVPQVRLCAPIPRPVSNVICLGRNYAEHAAESARASGQEVERPTFFTKAVTSVIGPFDEIPFDPDVSSQLDWEVELAVIIGRPARRVPAERALEHVFGYTVLNDVSARDVQFGYGGQYFYGKSLDGSCPMGPWIVTADEVSDPQGLNLRLRVNGVTKQEANTADMIFDVATIIEILSRGMTLGAGQIIATGTPAGVGFARTPPEFLKPGDVMETEIESIGTMRNCVAQPREASIAL
jgi:2-keto-4-pentenoate hydratase/2-oxohepta-3-ene-1,7-dioic acid hydratase in catechol pathway